MKLLKDEIEKYTEGANSWYIDENVVHLKLEKDKFVRRLGIIEDDRFIVYREKAKHLMKVNNSYGFSYEVINQLHQFKGIRFVDVYDEEGMFRLTIEDIKIDGTFLHFKEEGFEKQIFVPIDRIYKRAYSLEGDEIRKRLLGESWFFKLKAEFHKGYWKKLGMYVAQRRQVANVFPDKEDVFKAFKITPFEKTKVVILAQDPYYTKGVADGLAFSSKQQTYVPPALVKMYEAMETDVHFGNFLDNDPNLAYLARQGVLLLNTVLTVEEGQPQSHVDKGWERFTLRVLDTLKDHQNDLVFLLWGSKAKGFKEIIQNGRHLILEAEHPTYAHREGRRWNHEECFKRCNAFLQVKGYGTINW